LLLSGTTLKTFWVCAASIFKVELILNSFCNDYETHILTYGSRRIVHSPAEGCGIGKYLEGTLCDKVEVTYGHLSEGNEEGTEHLPRQQIIKRDSKLAPPNYKSEAIPFEANFAIIK
jgi:hypothetical protein